MEKLEQGRNKNMKNIVVEVQDEPQKDFDSIFGGD